MGVPRRRLIAAAAGESFSGSSTLSGAERTILGIVIGCGLVAALLIPVSRGERLEEGLFEALLMAAFGLFLWVPRIAAAALLVAIACSFAIDQVSATLLAGAIGIGLVVRTATRSIVVAYASVYGVLVLAAAFTQSDFALGGTIIVLVAAGLAAAVGALQRWAITSERRSAVQLVARAEQEAAAVHAERQRIADELHDGLAHDLTIIAMHSSVLERSPGLEERHQSQQAISAAARKGLADLRWMLGQMDVFQGNENLVIGDLASAVSDAVDDLAAAGWVVALRGADLTAEDLPRPVATALARIVREAATNALKHAQPERAELSFVSEEALVGVRMVNDIGLANRHHLPPGGYGTVRMAERVRSLGGTLDVGERDGRWILEVRLPRGISVPTRSGD